MAYSLRIALVLVSWVLTLTSSQTPVSFSILEEQDPGTFVMDILSEEGLKEKYTPEEYSSLVFEIRHSKYKDYFTAINGSLRTSTSLDRDNICPYELQCILEFDIKVTPQFHLIKVQIIVQDLNDNAPTFSSPVIELSLKESATVGTRLALPSAHDPDSPSFGVQMYNLLTESDVFALQMTDNEDGTKEAALELLKPVDRESTDSYSLELQAVDGGAPPKYGSVDINILIADVNDNSPVFNNKTYQVTISESTEMDKIIVTVLASDKDQDAVIFYSFSEKTQREYGDLFAIDEVTGEISVNNQLDFEQNEVYSLTVTARDSNLDSVPASAKVTVNLIDSNDNAPNIQLNLDNSGTAIQLSEAATLGDFVAHITVIDPDSGDNGEFDCRLNTDLFELEQLYPTEYAINTATSLDRETKGVYDVVMSCADRGSPAQTSTEGLTINIVDENDNSPQFSSSSYGGSVLEESPAGAFITRVLATDKDIGANQAIKYSLEEAAVNIFRIDEVSGNISTKIPLDYEKVTRIQFKVFATDQGEPARTSTSNVVVTVVDTDDEKPEFIQNSFTFAVYENGKGTQEVGTVQARDADSELFNSFTYSIAGDQDVFIMNTETGAILTKQTLDRESTPTFGITVLATGTGIKPQTSSATVTIYVADENDHDPHVTFPNNLNNTIHLSNRASIGNVFSRVEARDQDAGQNAQLLFTIHSGNEDSFFAVDKRSGVLSIAKEFSHVENQAFGLIIKVEDGGQPPRTTEAFLNIIVNKSISLEEQSSILMSSQNLTIVIAIACVSGVIMVVLLVAIAVIVRQQQRRANVDRKYNHIPKPLDRVTLEAGEGGRRKKEVSFDNVALDVEYSEQTKYRDDDDVSSVCSVDMSTADSGRGSHDGDSSEQTTTKPPSNNPSAGEIRTGQLEPGAYYQQHQQQQPQKQQQQQQQQQTNISNLFKRDVLYRSHQGGGEGQQDRPPRPPRVVVQEPVYSKPPPRRSLDAPDTCPVHSPAGRHSNVTRQHSNGSYQPSNHLQQPPVPPRKYKDDIIITGIVDSEIHV